MGVYQQFVPETRNRHRADFRVDHEASKNDSLFLRAGYQYRNPRGIQFESGNALTNLGIRDTKLTTATGVVGWTKILSPTKINEFRIGYNYDKGEQQSHFLVAEANAAMGLETAPSLGPNQVGFPSMNFAGGSAATRPTNIADGGRNADRTIEQKLVHDLQQLQLGPGRPLPQAGRALHAQRRRRWLRQGLELPRPVTLQHRTHRQRARGHAPRLHPRRRGLHQHARRPRRPFLRLGVLRPGRLEGQRQLDGLPGPALGARGAMERERRRARRLHPGRRRLPRRPERRGARADAAGSSSPRPLQVRGRARPRQPPDQGGQEQLQSARRVRLAARRQPEHRAAGWLRALPPDRCDPGSARPAGDQPVPLRASLGRRPARPRPTRRA